METLRKNTTPLYSLTCNVFEIQSYAMGGDRDKPPNYVALCALGVSASFTMYFITYNAKNTNI